MLALLESVTVGEAGFSALQGERVNSAKTELFLTCLNAELHEICNNVPVVNRVVELFTNIHNCILI